MGPFARARPLASFSCGGVREGGAMTDAGVSIDPICGKPVVEDGAETFAYKRRTYYFCSPACRGRFARRAERIRVAELLRLGALLGARKARWGVA